MEQSWGKVGLELFLLRRWDYGSAEKHPEQIQRLIKGILVENGEGTLQEVSEPSVPTDEHIEAILRPWRSNAQRDIASIISTSSWSNVWLRTCYGEDADKNHDKLVQPRDIELMLDLDYKLLLNDRELYNFRAHWQQIFYSIPEILLLDTGEYGLKSTRLREALSNFMSYEEKGIEGAPKDLVENLSFFSGTELTDAIHKSLFDSVHDACVVNWMIVEDEEALQTGEVWLLWLDCQGLIVRHKRIEVGDAVQVSGAWHRGSWYEMEEWEEASIGDEYQTGGSRDITHLNKLLAA